MFELTQEQRQAIENGNKPTLVFAGAGAGKTRVLVEKYLRLLDEGLTPSQILCLTFTTDAATEMKERLIQRLAERSSSLGSQVENTPNIGTIHSFCYQTLNQFGSELKLNKVEEILNPFTFASEFEKHYQIHLNRIATEDLAELLKYYTHTQLHQLALELYQKRHFWREATADESLVLTLVRKCFESFVTELEESFHAKGQYTFDDLEVLAIKLFENAPLAKEKLLSQFKAVLIDEFQDVSRSQWNFLRQIALAHPKGLFIVGDPKQSIYGFRHSEPELFYETANKLKTSNSNVVELNLNFRTEEKLLHNINALSQKLFQEITFSLMQAGITENSEETSFLVHSYDAENLEYRADLQSAELKETITKVKSLIDAGSSPSEIALLFRNADRMVEYQRELLKQGIPASLTLTLTFETSYEINYLLAYLRACLNPLDNVALCEFLRSPYVGYSFSELAKLQSSNQEPLFESLLKQNDPRLKWFMEVIDKGELEIEGLLKCLFSNSSYFPDSPEAFLFFLQAKEKTKLPLINFLEQIKTWKAHTLFTSIESHREDAVRLMTVHAAKGLEFDHVLLCDNLRQIPVSSPFLYARKDVGFGIRYKENNEIIKTASYQKIHELQKIREAEEANRILYVALTRAKKSLSLFLPKNAKKLPHGSWAKTLTDSLNS